VASRPNPSREAKQRDRQTLPATAAYSERAARPSGSGANPAADRPRSAEPAPSIPSADGADRERTPRNPSRTARNAAAPNGDARGVPDPAANRARRPDAADPAVPAAEGSQPDRRLRRARFLAELDEARELRKRVTPRRTRNAELHARLLRTFRY
jgi:hypothetical protein